MSDKLMQLCLDKARVLSTYAPEPLLRYLSLPLVQKALAVLVVAQCLKGANSYLSRRAQNSWTRTRPWNPAQEIAVLTGGSSGIGKQIMHDLADLGVRTVILDIQEPTFALPPRVSFYKTDITSPSALKAVAGQIRKEIGHPTILINNAGVGAGGTILQEPEAQIRLTLEVNLLSHFWTVKEFLPNMIQNDHGHIVTIASMASFVTMGEMADYGASKAGALAFHEGLTQEIRHWYGAKRVRTSVIHPFWVRTPMTKQLVEAGSHFRQKIMGPEDVSRAVVKQLVKGNGGQVVVPGSYGGAAMIRGLPSWMQDWIRNGSSQNIVRLHSLNSK